MNGPSPVSVTEKLISRVLLESWDVVWCIVSPESLPELIQGKRQNVELDTFNRPSFAGFLQFDLIGEALQFFITYLLVLAGFHRWVLHGLY